MQTALACTAITRFLEEAKECAPPHPYHYAPHQNKASSARHSNSLYCHALEHLLQQCHTHTSIASPATPYTDENRQSR